MDVFSMLEVDLEKRTGWKICSKKTKTKKTPLFVKRPERKAKEEVDSHSIPEDCIEFKAPLLNDEVVEKGIWTEHPEIWTPDF